MTKLRSRLGTGAIALAFAAAALLGLLSAAAFADELGGGAKPQSTGVGKIEASWSSGHVYMDLDGTEHEIVTAQDSFLFDMTAAPGDHVYRTSTIKNTGTADGVLEVAVLDPEINTASGAPRHDFEDGSNIFWYVDGGPVSRAQFSALRNSTEAVVTTGSATSQKAAVHEVDLAAGQSIDLTLGWEMPASETIGNPAAADSVTLGFDVLLTLRPAGGPQPPPPSPIQPTPTTPDNSPPATGHADGYQPGGWLPFTGVNAAVSLAVAAVICLLLGWILVAARRRRRRNDEEDLALAA
ncbi:MAG: hypothetical protein FWD29_07115 [Micrococcales bacterium]|nr:hypothetical protein [Micrococcales bacterium]